MDTRPTATAGSRKRPRSPLVQIYRPQLTSVLSIMHRATGIVLSIGSLLLTSWLIAAVTGPDAYAAVYGFIGSWFGLILLFGWTFALFYHLCNGIRHLFWDAVVGFELQAIYMSGWLVVTASVVLTLATWIIAITVQR